MGRSAAPRLLVLDDEFMIATSIADVLEDAGYVVAGPALTLAEARRIIELDEIDAAVLDVQLKNDLTLSLARNLERHGIPVLFVTAHAEQYLKSDFKSAPHLKKPFSGQQLLDQVSRMFARTLRPSSPSGMQ